MSVGIDFGNSKCCIATWDSNWQRIKFISSPAANTETTIDSFVSFTDTRRIFGKLAKHKMIGNLENTIFNLKLLIGRKYKEKQTRQIIKSLPFKVTKNCERFHLMQIEVHYHRKQQIFCMEETVSIILSHLHSITKQYFNDTTKISAVISVPSYFNHAQRLCIKQSAEIAGFNVLRLINETTATSICYESLNRNIFKDKERHIIVFDLGSSKLDVALLLIDDRVHETKAISGSTMLGGIDFDNRLMQYFIKEIQTKYKHMNTNLDAINMTKLRIQCESVKCALSTEHKATIKLNEFSINITRKQFEDLCNDYFIQCIEYISDVINDTSLSVLDIDDVVLVGGCSNIPRIQQLIHEFFNKKTFIQATSIDKITSVAYGSAIQSAILSGTIDDENDDILVLDCVPFSVGIQSADGSMNKLIECNKIVPCKAIQKFYTSFDNQKSLVVHVYEGKKELNEDSNLLGEYELHGIPPASKGSVSVDVMLDFDANGILHVSGHEYYSFQGWRHGGTIKTIAHTGQLSKDKVEKLTGKWGKWNDDERRLISMMVFDGFVRTIDLNQIIVADVIALCAKYCDL